jgi:4a-hydroxytetrahydrobiopterin dehydratase
MRALQDEECLTLQQGVPTANDLEIKELIKFIPRWRIIEINGVRQLERTYRFKNFLLALAFTNQVGEIAEEQNHHPTLLTEWGKVTVTWWTHVVKGLHRNDFIMAAKCDAIYQE